jgi:hypothetical protein
MQSLFVAKSRLGRLAVALQKEAAIERSTTELQVLREAPDVSRTRDHSKNAYTVCQISRFLCI